MSILSLLTDFGTQDGFIGVMKGVIWGICPDVKIADISHAVEPQNVAQGAVILSRVAPFFPEGTVHVAVIDPGVGTTRRAIAAQIGTQFCVVPDNGLLTLWLQDAEERHLPTTFVHLDNPDYWLKSITGTFHGRDLFAPVGAHLAAGVPLEKLGTLINHPVRLNMPTPEKTDTGYKAHITLIDHFGNIRTDLRVEKVNVNAKIRIAGVEIDGLVKSYGHREIGTLVALSDSGGYLEVAVVNGNAAKRLRVKIGEVVEVFG